MSERRHSEQRLAQEPDESRNASTPEQALLRGVLEQTLLDLRKFSRASSPAARAVVREIRAWLASDECSATIGGFTFVYICDHLSLSVDYMRELAHQCDLSAQRRERVEMRRAALMLLSVVGAAVAVAARCA